MIKIFHSLFSSFLESRSAEYLPCQVLFENSNGKSGYFDLFSWFWLSAIARFKNELALVNQEVTSYSHRTKTSWLNIYTILREVRRLRRSFLVFTTSKMPPRRCVLQYCSRVSDKELGISIHTSPSSGNICTKWKRFVSTSKKLQTYRSVWDMLAAFRNWLFYPCSPRKGNRKTNKARISSNHLEGNLGFYKRTKSKASE